MDEHKRVVVIGGGIAGLAAATYAAQAGHRVTLLERAQTPGGRAATHDKDGYQLNLGPHALYRGGPATEVLAELGVAWRGAPPPTDGHALDGDALRGLPSGFVSLLTTSLLPASGKLELGKLLATVGGIDTAALARTSVAAFLAERLRTPAARRVVGAILRLASYSDDPDRLSAGAAVAQLQRAIKPGVVYLDGGWQTLVRGLVGAAESAGVEIVTGARAEAIDRAGGVVRAVRLPDANANANANGRALPADHVIIAAGPDVARALCPDVLSLAGWAEAAVPVFASCLDVALSRLPRPRMRLLLGIDRPLYFSVHSAVARLAPEGGAVLHVARYGKTADPEAVERELEALLDRLQPGWRDSVVHRRFLPAMVVAHDLPQATRGGLAGRPGPRVPDAPGILVAGDWVGPVGMLADASLASARAAVQAIRAG